MNNKIFRIILMFLAVCISSVSTLIAVSFSLSNVTLGTENEDLNEENDNLNEEVKELHKVVGDLQDTMDNLDEHAAVATYKIDGEVWRIQIVQKNKEFELPVVDETETQVYNGWKVNGTGDAVQTTSISEHTEFELDMIDKDWVKVNWFGLNDFDAANVWTDGTDYYYSKGNMHFKKDQATKSWNQVTWSGLTNFDGNYVWNYNGETYYSIANINVADNVVHESHYVLDLANKTWVKKEWTNGPNGCDIFIIDGVCYSCNVGNPYYSGTLKLNGDTWEKVENWSEYQGSSVWTDGTDIYYNWGTVSFIFNHNTNNWDSFRRWTSPGILGEAVFYGYEVWTDDTTMYCSTGTSTYTIDTENYTLNEKTWIGGPSSLNGQYIWTDDENIYYSKGTEQYVFAKK